MDISLSTAREPAHTAAAPEKSVRPCASNNETFRQLGHQTAALRLYKNARTQHNQLFAKRAYESIAHHPHGPPCPLHAHAQNHTMLLEPAVHDGCSGHTLEFLLGFGLRTAANKPNHGHIPNAGACQTWQMRAARGHLPLAHGLTSINANACTLWANNPDVPRRQTTRQGR